MAEDDYKTEDHLTPNGWVTGTKSNFGRIIGGKISRPADAVLTMEYHDYQRSSWSASETSWEIIWRSPNIDSNEIQKLYDLFGGKPK